MKHPLAKPTKITAAQCTGLLCKISHCLCFLAEALCCTFGLLEAMNHSLATLHVTLYFQGRQIWGATVWRSNRAIYFSHLIYPRQNVGGVKLLINIYCLRKSQLVPKNPEDSSSGKHEYPTSALQDNQKHQSFQPAEQNYMFRSHDAGQLGAEVGVIYCRAIKFTNSWTCEAARVDGWVNKTFNCRDDLSFTISDSHATRVCFNKIHNFPPKPQWTYYYN